MTYLESIEPIKSIEAKKSIVNCPHENDKIHKNDLSSEHNFVLSEREAKAASLDAMAVCGEEDPGEGLEFLIEDHIEK